MSVDDTAGPFGVRLAGIAEIAELLDVQRATVDQWRRRNILPPPDWTISGRPIWHWSTVTAWASCTGRLPAT